MKRRAWVRFGGLLVVSLALGVPYAVPTGVAAAEDIKTEVVVLKAQDGGNSWGVLYTPANKTPQTVVIMMHPAGDYTRQQFLRPLVEAGYAAFGQNNRHVEDETNGVHEDMLLDIAAAVKYFKGRGIQKVVLIGSSGGGSLMAYYQAQAVTAPPNRVKSTPAGDPPNLNEMDLPPADGVLFIIPHFGEGKILETRIDPSVVNEGDQFSIDPTLDMYNPENGFRFPPEATRYSPEFVAKYRAAQKARMARLDQWARDLIAEQERYEAMMKSPDFPRKPMAERLWIERRAVAPRRMTVYRTGAELRYTDLTIDPSDRLVGDNGGEDSWNANYTNPNPNWVDPRAFLSTRSSISSNAVSLKNMPLVTVPSGILQGTAHRQIYPSDTKALFDAIGAKDKELMWIVGGDSGFRPSGPKAGKGDQGEQARSAVVNWVKKRFP